MSETSEIESTNTNSQNSLIRRSSNFRAKLHSIQEYTVVHAYFLYFSKNLVTKQTFFKLYLMKHPDFSSWIAAVKDDNKIASCANCNTTFHLSNMGEEVLNSHMKGKKHSQKLAPVKMFF